jgi:hypothetical protein
MNDRLIPIEEKILGLEHHVDQLDHAIRDIGSHVDTIRRDIVRMREQIDTLSRASHESGDEGPIEDGIVPPPHSTG